MKATIEEGKLKIDVEDLFYHMDPELKIKLAKHLVADDHLFGAVLDCVATGSFFEDWWFSRDRTLELREKLIPLMPEIAREAVRTALQQRNDAQMKAERMWNWAWQLFHAFPSSHMYNRPQLPDWMPAKPPTEEDIDCLF